MDFSIVIPALNEGLKIGRDVEAAGAFLSAQGLSGEVIVVDDGSDDETATVAESAGVPSGVERRVIRLGSHRGKGSAVRTGMTAARGEFAMFADSGLCVAFGNALRGLEMIRSGACEIAHGSRRLADSRIRVRRPASRRALSWLFRTVCLGVAGAARGLTDTQCGFKVYRGDVARALYAECISEGFMFDIEIVLRARRHGYRVSEFPIEWRCDLDSRLRPGRHIAGSLKELARIRRAMRDEANAPTRAAEETDWPDAGD